MMTPSISYQEEHHKVLRVTSVRDCCCTVRDECRFCSSHEFEAHSRMQMIVSTWVYVDTRTHRHSLGGVGAEVCIHQVDSGQTIRPVACDGLDDRLK